MTKHILYFVIAFSLLAGCSKNPSESNISTPESKSSTVEGKYFLQTEGKDEPDFFIDLREGTFLIKCFTESSHGQYRIDGDVITLLRPLGGTEEYTHQGNTLIPTRTDNESFSWDENGKLAVSSSDDKEITIFKKH